LDLVNILFIITELINHDRTVKTLLKKYKRAIKGISDTKPPFDELTHSLDDEKIAIWENDEKKAMEERGEYLDIYQLKIDQGNSSLLLSSANNG
jgi:hypothetical protein